MGESVGGNLNPGLGHRERYPKVPFRSLCPTSGCSFSPFPAPLPLGLCKLHLSPLPHCPPIAGSRVRMDTPLGGMARTLNLS